MKRLNSINLYSSSYFTSGRWKVCADLRQIAYLTRWLLLVVRLSAILGSVHFKTLSSQHIHSILISVFEFLNHRLYLISKNFLSGFPSIQWCPFQGSQFKTIAQDPYSSFPFFYSRVHTQTPIPEHSVSRGVLSKAHISKVGLETNSFPIEFSFVSNHFKKYTFFQGIIL